MQETNAKEWSLEVAQMRKTKENVGLGQNNDARCKGRWRRFLGRFMRLGTSSRLDLATPIGVDATWIRRAGIGGKLSQGGFHRLFS